MAMWRAMTREPPVPVALHLDHCPDRDIISECLAAGWNSVLFDAPELPRRGEPAPVPRDRGQASALRGEGRGRDRGHPAASRTASAPTRRGATAALEVAVDFIEATGVDIFAPAIGNAHGMYAAPPKLDGQRVSELVVGHRRPHGTPRWHRTDAPRSSPT